jgi:hypothetical protein
MSLGGYQLNRLYGTSQPQLVFFMMEFFLLDKKSPPSIFSVKQK